MNDCIDTGLRISNLITQLSAVAAEQPDWDIAETRIQMTKRDLMSARRACAGVLHSLPIFCSSFNRILDALASEYEDHRDWIKAQRVEPR